MGYIHNMRRFTLLLVILISFGCLLSAEDWNSDTFSLNILMKEGVITAKEQNYDLLYQNNFSGNIGVSFGNPLYISLYTGFSIIGNSNISNEWYRYRGFSTFESLIGFGYLKVPFINENHLGIEIIGGGSLAKYYNSDSYFFYPKIEMAFYYKIAQIVKNIDVQLGFNIPIFFRPDISNYGISVLLNINWYPFPKDIR